MSGTCIGCRYNHRDVKCPPCDLNYSGFEKELKSAEKTLLDEFAMAAMAAIISKSEHSISTTFEAMEKINQTCGGAYEYAAAMMKERARRDEMGNVKEATE
jgi:oligoendopeptidase F